VFVVLDQIIFGRNRTQVFWYAKTWKPLFVKKAIGESDDDISRSGDSNVPWRMNRHSHGNLYHRIIRRCPPRSLSARRCSVLIGDTPASHDARAVRSCAPRTRASGGESCQPMHRATIQSSQRPSFAELHPRSDAIDTISNAYRIRRASPNQRHDHEI
jgi:hypothetical protein